MAIGQTSPLNLNQITRILSPLFNDSYEKGLKQGNNWVTSHMQTVDTVKRAVDFTWYGDVDEPRQVGDLQPTEFTNFLGYLWELGMYQYENGARITKENWLADDLGMLKKQVIALGNKYALIWRYRAIDILNNGATAAVTTYDAVPLYSNAHIVGAGTFDNLLVGTNVFAVDVQTSYTAMQNFVGDTNVVRDDNSPTHVVIPPGMMFEVKATLGNANDPAANLNTENVNRGLLSWYNEPRLTDVNDFYLFRSDGVEQPFIGITNKAASSTGEKLVSDNRVNQSGQMVDKELLWKIHAFRGLHPTHPHLHAKVVNP